MRKITYLAVLEESTSGYGVYFPDVDGCVSFGSSIEEASTNAKEALELHIYGMEKDKDALPRASLKVEQNLGYLVPITIFPDVVRHEMNNRRVKTNVTIPLWLKEKAELEKINYSRLLELALLEVLQLK